MKKSEAKEKTKSAVLLITAFLIPLLFLLNAVQAEKYKKLSAEISELENRQIELVEKNRKLVSDIGILSSSDRIEKIAEEKLGMHKARTEDIVRVEITGDPEN